MHDWLASRPAGALARGPIAIILIEDDTEVTSTLRHHLDLGFARILALSPEPLSLDLAPADAARVTNLIWDTRTSGAHVGAVNAIIAAVPTGTWLYYGWNAEYLFYPFSETRRIGEMLAFHAEERRDAMLGFVTDLYPAKNDGFGPAIDREAVMFDRAGYYALQRTDQNGAPASRQMNFHGGLHWRYEEFLPPDRLRIDRVALFRAAPGLTLLPDHRFSDEEYNTYACQWHNNLTCAIASFRVAKALLRNPRSRDAVDSFVWAGSERFDWSSQQLMEAGLMEPGQWF
ncbi:hypothetical protein DRW48_15555 [Paracoccus suum]|uniref:Glycosyltransferase family 2 protein n=1 Tax=Paracoccus suum TaxID=2259340 RepID=A0A344PPN3_9RHOB|nr:hypothetical protein DRW48_15555 [Paracoccus suum]